MKLHLKPVRVGGLKKMLLHTEDGQCLPGQRNVVIEQGPPPGRPDTVTVTFFLGYDITIESEDEGT
jgi:hypothetical protein